MEENTKKIREKVQRICRRKYHQYEKNEIIIGEITKNRESTRNISENTPNKGGITTNTGMEKNTTNFGDNKTNLGENRTNVEDNIVATNMRRNTANIHGSNIRSDISSPLWEYRFDKPASCTMKSLVFSNVRIFKFRFYE